MLNPVLDPWCQAFPRSQKHLKKTGDSSVKKRLLNLAVGPSLPGYLLFVSEFTDFMKSYKYFCLTKIKVFIRYFSLLRILVRNSEATAAEVCLV